jgi:predicted methyltransferase
MTRTLALAGTLCAALLVAAPAAQARGISRAVAKAVADPARPADDRERDANRKPAECLEFAGVKPGEQVVELIPGRGYFTRLFSAVVGSQGKVYALAPARRPNAPPDSKDPAAPVQEIAGDPHYANVEVMVQRPTEFSLPQGVDLVWTSQNYHDFHNIPDFSVATLDKRVFEALKPGGLYIVLDHTAAAGSGFRDTSTLHRIDPEAVKKEVESVGFKLEAESTILHNPDDPHTAKVFDPSIRGHTDQFILKFRKPK